jgi:hypothetical protein
MNMIHRHHLLKIIIGAVNVGGDDGGEIAAVLFTIGTTRHIQHALRVGISLIGMMRCTQVKHSFINRVGNLVGEHASAQTRHQLLYLKLFAQLQNYIVHNHVFTVKFHLHNNAMTTQ